MSELDAVNADARIGCMFWWQPSEALSRAKGAAIAFALTFTLLLGEAIAADHHNCHADGDEQCTVCLLAKAPSCLPEVSPPASPLVVIRQRIVLAPISQPITRRLNTNTTRGPPPNPAL